MDSSQRDDGQPRVVITGMGVLTTVGENLDEYRDALLAGRSGITRWKHMDEAHPSGIYSKIGGDMSDFDLAAHVDRAGRAYPAELAQRMLKLLRATPLAGQLSSVAALQAYVDAGLPDPRLAPERIGHLLGGTNLNVGYIRNNVLQLAEEPDFIDGLFGLFSLDTDTLSVASEMLTLKGASMTVGGACASGNLAVQIGLDLIRAGRADAVLATGGAIDLDPTLLQGWAIMDALSYRSFNDEPQRASRPFDARREGFVPSHGAGAVFLESLSSARSRGARIHAEVLGAGSASDASRLTRPDREGQVRAMRAALDDARVRPEQVDYVNAHATSTMLGDATEVAAIKQTLGERAYQIPVNSTKSMIGHCVTAASTVELIATVLQIECGAVHPTINQEEKDPELDVDFVPNEARQYPIDIAISNAFGFGGLNSCVVVGRMG